LDKVNVVTPEVKNAIKNAQTALLAKGNVEDSNSSEMQITTSIPHTTVPPPSKGGTTIP
jgi:hypothetical protein